MDEANECPECCGNGQTYGPNSGEDIICPDCKGAGRIAARPKPCEVMREALVWIARICREEMPLEYNDAMRKVFQRNISEAAEKAITQ